MMRDGGERGIKQEAPRPWRGRRFKAVFLCALAFSFVPSAHADETPPACSLTVSPSSGNVPLAISVSGSCTPGSNSDQNSIVELTVNWGDGSASLTSTQSQVTGTHTYTRAGRFQVVLTGTDSNGNTGSASQLVTVTTEPPPPPPPPAPSSQLSCKLTISPSSGQVPFIVTASTTCSDSKNEAVSILVGFGDGFYLSGANASHTYVNAGSFDISVVASDKSGNTFGPVSQPVRVSVDPALFIGISSGKIGMFNKSGTLLKTLNSGLGGSMTGMAFDAAGNLYATNFTADSVSKFDGQGALLGTFGTGYNCKPESIVFDHGGNAYVGETGCSHALLRFDAYGNLAASYSVATEKEGSDWIDLAPDHCTIVYTSQGASVLRFDACSKRQLPPFSSALKEGLALRLLPDGGLLVANLENIVRLDSAGRTISNYVDSGEKCWASLALDSDGSSFWAADYCTSDVVRFDITSGNELFKFNTGTAANTVFGLAERTLAPGPPAPAGLLIASPTTATVTPGQSASYVFAFTALPEAVGQSLSFSCANLPLGANCSFSPTTVVAQDGAATVNLTITTTAGPSAWLTSGSKSLLYGLCLPLALALISSSAAGRWKRARLLGVLILMSIVIACSGAKSSISNTSPLPAAPLAGTATPAGTYSVLIRASGDARESSTAAQLTVR